MLYNLENHSATVGALYATPLQIQKLSESQIKPIKRFHRFENKIIREIGVIRKISDSDKKETKEKGISNMPLHNGILVTRHTALDAVSPVVTVETLKQVQGDGLFLKQGCMLPC